MVCGKPLYFFKSTVVSLHFHCLSTVCICSVIVDHQGHGQISVTREVRQQSESDFYERLAIVVDCQLFAIVLISKVVGVFVSKEKGSFLACATD